MKADKQLPLQNCQQFGDKRLILIVGPGRSGTNHLVRLLRRIPNVSARGEPFNPNAAWGLTEEDVKHLATWSGTPFTDKHDPQLKRLLMRQPTACLEQMLQILPLGRSVLIVKVLTEQISPEQLESTAASGFLASCVVVRRRLIDSFISLTKAKMLSKWLNKDTTNVQVELNAEAFKAFLERHHNWHRQVLAVMRRYQIPLGVMDYETDIDCDEDKCVQKFIQVAGEHLFQPDWTSGPEGLAKQDRNVRIEDKVANWPEFSNELRQRGLLDKAMSTLEI